MTERFERMFLDTAPLIYFMDALQLASACVYGCDVFLTNDKQLCQFTELRCVTLD